jgi:PAS domain S-box-containing protein
VFGVWQAVEFSYQRELKRLKMEEEVRIREIREREFRFWTQMALRSPSAIIAVDCKNGKIKGWNPAATKIFGYTPEEVSGKSFIFLVPDEYLKNWYYSSEEYLDLVTDPVTYTKWLNGVRVINNAYVKAKSGELIKCRVTIRTVGGGEFFYLVTIDPVGNTEIIEPPSPFELKKRHEEKN